MFPRIRIVLVETYHPGNLGSAARAMKTMGLEKFYLVNPVSYPHPEATQLAAGAEDLLNQAIVCNNLEEAVKDCSLVIGASARLRHLALTNFNPRQAAQALQAESQQGDVALVFGRERSGLHNDELSFCTHQVSIDGNPDYSILNIAQAVQILCYEIFTAGQEAAITKNLISNSSSNLNSKKVAQLPSLEAIQGFEEHLEKALTASGFLNGASDRALKELQTFFRRARPNQHELGILRSLVSRLEKQGTFYYQQRNTQHKEDTNS